MKVGLCTLLCREFLELFPIGMFRPEEIPEVHLTELLIPVLVLPGPISYLRK